MQIGYYDAAIAFFEAALQISQTIDTLWALAGCRHNIGYVYADRGQVERAITEMEESIRLSEQIGFISPLIIGVLSDHFHDMGRAFWLVAIMLLVGGVLWLLGVRHLEKDTELAPQRLALQA